ncbi:hypothetical protein F5Y16DRAFT_398183 [Xylariaceae sp. FL0255]|nr:hypothetical protein F5Y16DRAFT_398183 [Xylariaceae sp. FL0255]
MSSDSKSVSPPFMTSGGKCETCGGNKPLLNLLGDPTEVKNPCTCADSKDSSNLYVYDATSEPSSDGAASEHSSGAAPDANTSASKPCSGTCTTCSKPCSGSPPCPLTALRDRLTTDRVAFRHLRLLLLKNPELLATQCDRNQLERIRDAIIRAEAFVAMVLATQSECAVHHTQHQDWVTGNLDAAGDVADAADKLFAIIPVCRSTFGNYKEWPTDGEGKWCNKGFFEQARKFPDIPKGLLEPLAADAPCYGNTGAGQADGPWVAPSFQIPVTGTLNLSVAPVAISGPWRPCLPPSGGNGPSGGPPGNPPRGPCGGNGGPTGGVPPCNGNGSPPSGGVPPCGGNGGPPGGVPPCNGGGSTPLAELGASPIRSGNRGCPSGSIPAGGLPYGPSNSGSPVNGGLKDLSHYKFDVARLWARLRDARMAIRHLTMLLEIGVDTQGFETRDLDWDNLRRLVQIIARAEAFVQTENGTISESPELMPWILENVRAAAAVLNSADALLDKLPVSQADVGQYTVWPAEWCYRTFFDAVGQFPDIPEGLLQVSPATSPAWTATGPSVSSPPAGPKPSPSSHKTWPTETQTSVASTSAPSASGPSSATLVDDAPQYNIATNF